MTTQHDENYARAWRSGDMGIELAGYQWVSSEAGESGATVIHLHGKPGAPDLYLKHGRGSIADEVAGEASRLDWLAGRLPVPLVNQFRIGGDEAWLLMHALPGETAYQALEARPEERMDLVDELARFLRTIHSLPVEECPYDAGHLRRLLQARARIDAGLVDEDDFDEERQGWSAEQVWHAMHRLLPFEPDLVVTHGDYSLDNLLIMNGSVSGCIDVGRMGTADRYQDLAIIWNCLGEFGAPLQKRFLDRYGIEKADENRLNFHLMLDELF